MICFRTGDLSLALLIEIVPRNQISIPLPSACNLSLSSKVGGANVALILHRSKMSSFISLEAMRLPYPRDKVYFVSGNYSKEVLTNYFKNKILLTDYCNANMIS